MDRSGTRPHTAATAAPLANSCPSRKTMPTSKLPPVTLVLGGARSGKYTYPDRMAATQAGLCLHLPTAAAAASALADLNTSHPPPPHRPCPTPERTRSPAA